MLTLGDAAQGFSAVGSEPRLDLLLMLVRAGPDGLSIGDLQRRLATPGSTLAHHLRFLVGSGLVEQEKQGRTVVNRAAFARIEALAGFLLHQCCADVDRNAETADLAAAG